QNFECFMYSNNKRVISVLIIQNHIPNYRIPLYNYLASLYENLTICHSGSTVTVRKIFNEYQLHNAKKGRFVFQNGLSEVAEKYDVVIAMFDLSWISIMLLLFKRKRKYKLILWGIGVSTAKGFDSITMMDRLRFFLARLADALIFY